LVYNLLNADRTIVIKGKTIADMGTHEELMQKQFVYYQLFTDQLQGSLISKKVQEDL
jgi:ABC-type multidrug transport system fused ATPase/permease subunit